jgi:hypothetical protein
MTQAANWGLEHTDDEAEPTPVVERALAAVPGLERLIPGHEDDREADRQMGLARAIFIGSLIGFAIVFTVVCVIGLAAGYDTVDAMGVGAFAGLWGGPGFGGMMAATIRASHHE